MGEKLVPSGTDGFIHAEFDGALLHVLAAFPDSFTARPYITDVVSSRKFKKNEG